MKKYFKLIMLAAVTFLCAVGLFACNGADPEQANGLLITKYTGDEFYTVVGYVCSEDVTSLDIASAAPQGKVIGRIKAGAFDKGKSATSSARP